MADKKLDQTINRGLKTAKEALAEKLVDMARKERDDDEPMEETVYNVVFTGTFTKDEKIVIAAMAKFFKQGQEATKRLLKAGRVIKNFDNKMAADKLAKMLNTIGLQSRVELEVIAEERETSLLEKAAYKLDATDAPSIRLPVLSQFSWKQWAAVGVVVVVVVGFGAWSVVKPPVIKGNSFVTYQASVKKMVDHEPEETKAVLVRAIDLLTGAGFQFQEHNTFGGNEEVAANMAYGSISGMTSSEILVAGEASVERQRAYYREEIQTLEQAIADERAIIADAQQANAGLNRLELSDPQLVWGKEDAPVMDFKLVNNSDEVLSRLYVEVQLYDASGALVNKGDFTFTTAFGIPVGATKYISLFAPKDSPWTADHIRTNWRTMKFKPSVANAENVAGKKIGIDLRPNERKIQDAQKEIAKLQKELASMAL